MLETEFTTQGMNALLQVLPLSPFREFLQDFAGIPFLGYLNWFVPVNDILSIFSAWLVCYGTYLLYSIFMRWLKVIGD